MQYAEHQGHKPDETTIDLSAQRVNVPGDQSADDPSADVDGGPVMFQSMAIMEYLEEMHQLPAAPDARGRAARGPVQI